MIKQISNILIIIIIKGNKDGYYLVSKRSVFFQKKIKNNSSTHKIRIISIKPNWKTKLNSYKKK